MTNVSDSRPCGFTSERLERLRAGQPPQPAPLVPASLQHVRGDTLRDWMERIPHVHVYRRYQRDCIRTAASARP